MTAIVAAARANAAEYFVSSAAEISSVMQTAQPGDILTMLNGTWTNQRIQFAGHGTSGAPITLRAQTPGQVLLDGNSKINISGDWLVVDGLRFEGGALGANDHVVEFRGSKGEATNSRFTNSAIIDYNPASIDTRYFWVSLYGEGNRVDHNYFRNQNHSGVTVVVWRNNSSADHHVIDANHFADRPVGNDNGWETIRIGTSDTSLSDSHTVVENNLFERTNGEIEAISNKSGSNIFRYNTFREMAATLTLRHGNDNRVEGNFFLGANTNNSGAIRVIGERQTIVNNYIANVDNRAGGAISISAGVPDSELNEYFQVRDALVAHNTLLNVDGPAITFDDGLGSSGRSLLAENVTIANNLFRSGGPAIFEGNQGAGWTWQGNIAFGGSLGPVAGNPGIAVTDPELQLGPDGLWRPGAMSPAIDGGHGDYSSVLADDMDGQPRIGIFDVGADEVSTATLVRRPLVGSDVGTSWMHAISPTPPGGGCNAAGCALQAEAFDAVFDPDGDGAVWTVVDVPTALGQKVIKAPGGNLVSQPGTHETVVSYEMLLETPGTYTAYYRVRGFSGSTDSFYSPDAFGVDPDNATTTSQDGVFIWKKDTRTFAVSPSHIGMPLDFRLGMREQQAEIDAIVLNLNSSLASAELDALFAVVPGDYNQDGVVDAADYVTWRRSLNSRVPAWSGADGSGNGQVGPEDYSVWRAHFDAASFGVGAHATVPEPQSVLVVLISTLGLCFGRNSYCKGLQP